MFSMAAKVRLGIGHFTNNDRDVEVAYINRAIEPGVTRHNFKRNVGTRDRADQNRLDHAILTNAFADGFVLAFVTAFTRVDVRIAADLRYRDTLLLTSAGAICAWERSVMVGLRLFGMSKCLPTNPVPEPIESNYLSFSIPRLGVQPN
jgi:hypothetical protein